MVEDWGTKIERLHERVTLRAAWRPFDRSIDLATLRATFASDLSTSWRTQWPTSRPNQRRPESISKITSLNPPVRLPGYRVDWPTKSTKIPSPAPPPAGYPPPRQLTLLPARLPGFTPRQLTLLPRQVTLHTPYLIRNTSRRPLSATPSNLPQKTPPNLPKEIKKSQKTNPNPDFPRPLTLLGWPVPSTIFFLSRLSFHSLLPFPIQWPLVYLDFKEVLNNNNIR